MGNLILKVNTLIVFVVNHLFGKNQLKKVKKVMMKLVFFILDSLLTRIKSLLMENGYVVEKKIEKIQVVQKTNIVSVNGQTKKLKNISLTNL